MSAIARRYARALFEVAEAAHASDAVANDLARLREAFGDAQVRAVLLGPETPREKVQGMMDKLLSGGHEITGKMVRVVLGRRREAVLPDLHDAFGELLREARGEVRGLVESAKPMSHDALTQLEQKMTGLIGRQVRLELAVEPGLIGGVRVRVGNTLYDGSVATALEDLERRLMEAPV
ncbi:MAG: ATP synthase F1 subunit delta [Planctomycetota bacterium]